MQLLPLSPMGKKMGRKLRVVGAGYLLLKRVQKHPGGVLEEKGGVGEEERLFVRARKSKSGSLGRLWVRPHVCNEVWFGKMELRLCWILLTSCEQMIFCLSPHGKALRPFLQSLDQNCLGHLKNSSHLQFASKSC